MHLYDDPISLYDILELTSDATPQEIRSAYLRLKSAYNKENIAHYTVFSRDETEQMLQSIENAYLTLSNPEKRCTYDQNQGVENTASQTHSAPVFSIGNSSTLAISTVVPQPDSGNSGGNDVDFIIKNEQNWNGSALKRIREAKRITLEDLSDFTRISKSYLLALEEEDFKKLPANVYIRGFLQQVCKRLKLPSDLVATQYLSLLKIARPDK